MKKWSLFAFLIPSFCFAAPITDLIPQSETVQRLVQTIAAQSFSGDPVYCDFAPSQMKIVSKKREINILKFQVVLSCGAGESEKNHATNIKVNVKGWIEDSQVFVSAVQVGSDPTF